METILVRMYLLFEKISEGDVSVFRYLILFIVFQHQQLYITMKVHQQKMSLKVNYKMTIYC
jgi:hypothetical protein